MRKKFHVWSVVVGLAMAGTATFAAEKESKPVLENDRVRVTHVDLMKGATVPADRRYEAVTVQVGKGETQFIDPPQLAKAEPEGVGQVHYFVPRSKRGVKNGGNTPVSMVVVQFLRPVGKYVALDVPPSHYCNSGSSKACVTERYMFCTDRFCAENVTLDPGAISTYHLHADDYLIVATSDFTWSDEVSGQTPKEITFKAGDVKYMEAGARHRLTNTGNTTATLFVIQFK